MTNDTAVQALLDYLNESDEPEIYWPRHHFEESCFSRWAAWEMIEAIMDHPMKDPEDVIEEFAIKMVFSHLSQMVRMKVGYFRLPLISPMNA